MVLEIPISVKGIMIDSEGKTLLLKNERELWELPGGRIEEGEQPEDALKREVQEELGIEVTIKRLNDTWIYEVHKERYILIITFEVAYESAEVIRLNEEHIDMGWFSVAEIEQLNAADGYKNSIKKAMYK
ncbi:hypothetical protein AMS62_20570 [Bacillus sp. FJAT-18019]|nr:hypothetical protein AMS62_20570 [Bacillus sp. FJAT-18019]